LTTETRQKRGMIDDRMMDDILGLFGFATLIFRTKLASFGFALGLNWVCLARNWV
jgi:hypothetical protein